MMDYETFIKTNFSDKVEVTNPDIAVKFNLEAPNPEEFSFLINEPVPAPIEIQPPRFQNTPESLPPAEPITDYLTQQKEKALADYTNHVRKLTLSLEKQKSLYKEHSQQLKNQLDQKLETIYQQSNKLRIELRQQVIEQRSEQAHQLEAYEREFHTEKSDLIRRHTEEIAAINNQFRQDFLEKETESKQKMQALETEHLIQVETMENKIKEMQSYYEGERQKFRLQYEPIIQNELVRFQKTLHEVKEKRDQLLQDSKEKNDQLIQYYEAERQRLRDHFDPLIQSDKDHYSRLLLSTIKEKESLINELNTLVAPNS